MLKFNFELIGLDSHDPYQNLSSIVKVSKNLTRPSSTILITFYFMVRFILLTWCTNKTQFDGLTKLS